MPTWKAAFCFKGYREEFEVEGANSGEALANAKARLDAEIGWLPSHYLPKQELLGYWVQRVES